MSADKKVDRSRSPYPDKEDKKQKGPESMPSKVDNEKDKKTKRVNYVIKDLPIY